MIDTTVNPEQKHQFFNASIDGCIPVMLDGWQQTEILNHVIEEYNPTTFRELFLAVEENLRHPALLTDEHIEALKRWHEKASGFSIAFEHEELNRGELQ